VSIANTTFEQRAKWQVPAMFAPFLVGIAALFIGRIIQDQRYHDFADQRTLLGIPNFWNVVSNLPFAVVGLWGLRAFRDLPSRVLFTGIFLVAFGSAWYHLAPDDARLVWDRLPMTIAFMSLLAIVLGARTWTLAALVACGIASIVWWRVTGNLAPYVVIQFGPILILLILMMTGRARGLWPVVLLYALAKVAELEDVGVYSTFPLSGHTLKHLLAGGATWFIFRWRRAEGGL
jgi:hypothetical protein